ncbi:hypothetical protein RirG_081470 [Rhizophagus irregularis DAOM 197198w]|uniref:Uncharacterized protein n=1 Tax=Rhizophagus irregularis (strain DAOM 197198w) TaxID=1432141 RepID=A0A015MWI0_RHIIW|nr:hypothetical protein RirG_081470 [Rhizophagus irregularis DAOM 197198w]
MGLNAPNSKYFCLYCECESNIRWDMNLKWPINKNTQSKKKPKLFPVIKQKNYIPDELHLLLCISDVLMECFFNDLFKKKEFEWVIKSQIEQTMKSIQVHFEFFKSQGEKWDWTSLMGPDKKKVLQHFPVTNFISGRRGEDIQKLWRNFYDLYMFIRQTDLKDSEIDDFEIKVKEWIYLFCRPNQGQINLSSQVPGLYRKEDVTPIEKKNHNQVQLFFGGTTMGGGIKGKSVVQDIMEFENRQLFYLLNNTSQEIQIRNINVEDKENNN